MTLVAFKCALANFICYGGNWLLGQNMADQPIVVGPLVGWLLGDLQTGLILGAVLQGLYIGAVNVGGAISMNPSFGTTLSVAFAILSGGGESFALAIAIPLGLLGGAIEMGLFVLGSLENEILVSAAAEGNQRKIAFLHYGVWLFRALPLATVVFISVLAGATPVTNFVNSLPEVVLNGLGVVSGLVPAVGFAMLLTMVWSNKLALYYIFGFILVAYLQLPLIVVAVVGLTIAVAHALIDQRILSLSNNGHIGASDLSGEEREEEDFLS